MIKNIIKNKKALIFDFDGTLFHLFTTFDFSEDIKSIKNYYSTIGYSMPDTWNPFDALKLVLEKPNTIENKRNALIYTDTLLTKRELEAVKVGKPVNGAKELLRYLLDNGYNIAIASNNSELAALYFKNKYFKNDFIPIIGRQALEPEKLKPNPWMLEKLMSIFDLEAKDVVFLGDHPRDKSCADLCGCSFIGITPADYKRERMLRVLPEEDICNDLMELLNIIK